MVVGLVGAVMTAAYMTRCIYLTFFGEYRGGTRRTRTTSDGLEHDPRDDVDARHARAARDNWLITVPLWVLSFLSIWPAS